MKPSTKALQLSSKISIRMDTRGFLSLQYMILSEEGHVSFVEYLVSHLKGDRGWVGGVISRGMGIGWDGEGGIGERVMGTC